MSYNYGNRANINEELPHRGYYSPRMYERARAGLKAHWTTFILVNLFLFLLNVFTGYYYPWHLFPLLSWGIGIAIHTSVVKIRERHPVRMDRNFLVHLAVFLIVNGYLFFINILTDSWYLWFIWPMLSWGIGLGCHYVSYRAKKRRLSGLPVSNYYVLWYPGIVCIYLALVDLFTGDGFDWFLWPSVPIMLIAYVSVDRHANAGYYRNVRRQTMPVVNHPIPDSTDVGYHRSVHASDQRPIKFCPRCGESVESDFLFCEYCGQKLR